MWSVGFSTASDSHRLEKLGDQQFGALTLIRLLDPLLLLMLHKFRRDVQPSLETCFKWYSFLVHLTWNYPATKSLLSFLCFLVQRWVCPFILYSYFLESCYLALPIFSFNINQQYLWNLYYEPSALLSHSYIPYLQELRHFPLFSKFSPICSQLALSMSPQN